MTTPPHRLVAALADQYTIEREIGAGGMATVYLAHDQKHNRNVAVKVLRPELAAVIGTERFLKEIEVTANLQHPNILPLFDSGEADSFLFYVMPYIDGESLRAKLDRETQVSLGECVRIGEAVANALAYAHQRGVIHRDIKPENILLHQGQPVVADFGIALAVSAAGGKRLTETGLSVGTPEYMSPEQATGSETIDARSDMYALSCVVYEMLTGEPPHRGPNVQAVIARVVAEEPRRVSSVRSTVPEHVEYAVHRGLAKLPADRFAKIEEFAQALRDPSTKRKWIGSLTLSGGDTWTRFVVRNRWLRWGMPLGTATLAVVALWGWLRSPSGPAPSVARFPIPFAVGTTWGAQRQAVAIAPGGDRIAYVTDGDGGDDQQLYVRRLDQLHAEVLPGTEGALDPFFSPDGRWIGFALVDGLKRVPATGGPPVTITVFPEPRGAAWTSDDIIYFGSTSGLWQVLAAGGTAEQVTELQSGELLHSRPDLLPNGRGLVFTIASGGAEATQVAVRSLRTGVVTELFPGLAPRYLESGHLVYGRPDGRLMGIAFDAARMQAVGEPVPLIDGVLVKPTNTMDYAVSRTGTLVYLSGAVGSREMVLVDRSGRERSLPGVTDSIFGSPRFSSDGARLAFGLGTPPTRQIWTYDFEDSTMTPLTFEGHNYYPVWSPNDERVAYASETADAVDLRWAAADGNGAWETLLSNGGWNYPSSWSPDGRYLVYREQDPPTEEDIKTDIMILPLSGERTPYAFLELPTSREEAPTISPDGRWLAYASDLSGRYEVYVNGFPSPGRRRQISVAGGTSPVWSRDGSALFYRVSESLIEVAVSTTPEFAVLRRTVVFDGPYADWPYHSAYDIAPNGRDFVMIKHSEQREGELVIVLNWLDEIRQKMEGG